MENMRIIWKFSSAMGENASVYHKKQKMKLSIIFE